MAELKTTLIEKSNGVVNVSDISRTNGYPSSERFSRGPVPIIECVEEIPCNPCETVCNRNLIKVGKPITNFPSLVDPDGSCTGCKKCIVICPGLAIFIIDKTSSSEEALISLPYEELPLPEKGEKIFGINRGGKAVCKGYVHSVLSGERLNHTNVVTIVVPKEYADEVRYLRRSES
jgi:Fe-S-cluster-containing hydrogenase component 2